MAGTVICWFKRDLRITDHPALARAAGLGAVIPVYIVEPEMWVQPDAAGRHYGFFARRWTACGPSCRGWACPW